jgi:hypothetical protein
VRAAFRYGARNAVTAASISSGAVSATQWPIPGITTLCTSSARRLLAIHWEDKLLGGKPGVKRDMRIFGDRGDPAPKANCHSRPRPLLFLDHHGKGNITFEERPFVVMVDRAHVDLGVVEKTKPAMKMAK